MQEFLRLPRGSVVIVKIRDVQAWFITHGELPHIARMVGIYRPVAEFTHAERSAEHLV